MSRHAPGQVRRCEPATRPERSAAGRRLRPACARARPPRPGLWPLALAVVQARPHRILTCAAVLVAVAGMPVAELTASDGTVYVETQLRLGLLAPPAHASLATADSPPVPHKVQHTRVVQADGDRGARADAGGRRVRATGFERACPRPCKAARAAAATAPAPSTSWTLSSRRMKRPRASHNLLGRRLTPPNSALLPRLPQRATRLARPSVSPGR